MRSVDEPVQKPSQVVWSSMYCASSGVSIAAPCATRMMSFFNARSFWFAASVRSAVCSMVSPES